MYGSSNVHASNCGGPQSQRWNRQGAVSPHDTVVHHPPPSNKAKPVPTFVASTKEAEGSCIGCKGEKHPLYSCSKFRSMSHDEMIALLKLHSHCLNCLRPGHFVKDCKSLHHCKVCQRPHHLLLHVEKPPSADHTDVSANHASGFSRVVCF